MAWPPPVLPINRTNADPQQDTHPADHNALALAINDTVPKLQSVERSAAVPGWLTWIPFSGAPSLIPWVPLTVATVPFLTNTGSSAENPSPWYWSLLCTGKITANGNDIKMEFAVNLNGAPAFRYEVEEVASKTNYSFSCLLNSGTNPNPPLTIVATNVGSVELAVLADPTMVHCYATRIRG